MATLRQLSSELQEQKLEKVHFVVQEYVEPSRKGHLSNERRLSHEPRDFVAEFELDGELPGYTVPVAVRRWRDGDELKDFDLSCNSEAGVTLTLKRVALWAAGLSSRILFEWVWNGTMVRIVQADLARSVVGVNPHNLRPKVVPEIKVNSLKSFRPAGKVEFERYGKLRNAQTYSNLGYKLPIFYVLDNPTIIQKLLEGTIPDSVHHDLQELTRRQLMIRTDGLDVPAERRQMLPRSEGLLTSGQAKKWLASAFREEIKRLELTRFPLCLIAHHFIPSIAAAWARFEPGIPRVRIESLWGLPEGLYWHSHDTFEVDLENDSNIRRRLRFKGTFVAPDEHGKWLHYRPSVPFDWGASITRKAWLLEIAKTTKLVAENEQKPVTVMWFVDNDPRATIHKVLPWYHTESEIGSPKAAPRRKWTMTSDFKIETIADWEDLKLKVAAGKRIERVLLEPRDPELVRNQDFARQLAAFAAAHKIAIELAGGILSHAYHILQLHGASVECVDLFGADEEKIEYNKLVRDKIPDLIKRKGEGVEALKLKGDALFTALRQKLVEESFEALDARPGDELVGELADLQEVIAAICDSLHISTVQLEAERDEKRRRRGGFSRGLMLQKTSTPHTLSAKPLVSSAPPLPGHNHPEEDAIENAIEIPNNRTYSRPDLRNRDDLAEALLTFEAELSKLGITKRSAIFEFPIGGGQKRTFKISVELTRHQSSVWSQVRLKLEPSQIPLNLTPDSQLHLQFPEDNNPRDSKREKPQSK